MSEVERQRIKLLEQELADAYRKPAVWAIIQILRVPSHNERRRILKEVLELFNSPDLLDNLPEA